MTRIFTPLAPVRVLGITFAALLLAWAAAAVAAPKVVGIASAVVNDVRISINAGKSYPAAKVRQRVSLGNRVRTGSASRLQLVLLDKTKFSVGANAQLTIDKFVYDPNGGEVSATILQGVFRFFSGKSHNARKSVRTPSATIGIRGTIFDGAVGATAVAIAQRENAVPRDIRHDPLTATLVVLRGPGPARQANLPVGLVDVTGGGETVTLDAPLLAAYVPYAGATPIGPFPISSTGLGQLSDFIVPPPERFDAPFTTSSLPFPPDRPNGPPPPPYYGGPRPGSGNDGYPGVGGIPGIDGFPTFPGSRDEMPHNDSDPGHSSDPPSDGIQDSTYPGSNEPNPRQPSATPPTSNDPGMSDPRQPRTPLGTLTNDPQQPSDPYQKDPAGYPPNQPRDPYQQENGYPSGQPGMTSHEADPSHDPYRPHGSLTL